jgi:maleylacetate reductase
VSVFPGLPARVVFGAGSVETLPDEIDRLGVGRVVVLSTPGQRPAAEAAAARLGHRALAVHPHAVMHVPVAVALAAVAYVRELGADACLTVGGGSATGLGKAVARETGLPLVALPTTYSGSEITPVWGLTGPDGKQTGRDARVAPKTVIYDPDLTRRLPLEISVTSAVNAMAHAVEAGYAPDRTPITDLLAPAATATLLGGIDRLPASGADSVDARADLLRGAWLAGSCLAVATMGLHHKLCHVLGGLFDLDHAWTHTVLLPYVMRFNLGDDRGLSALLGRHGLRRTLADLGMPAAGVATAAAATASSSFANPRPAGESEIRGLLQAAYDGAG